jgi:hypothetical protein
MTLLEKKRMQFANYVTHRRRLILKNIDQSLNKWDFYLLVNHVGLKRRSKKIIHVEIVNQNSRLVLISMLALD